MKQKWGKVGKSGETPPCAGKVVAGNADRRVQLCHRRQGRLNFPPKFREAMGGTFIVTRWLDDCLVAFPEDEWERISALLSEKSMVKSRDVQRFLYATAVEASPDKQGRILLPANLRQHAKLEKDVTVIGVGRHAEIWNTQAWQQMNERLRSGPIAAAMEELEF